MKGLYTTHLPKADQPMVYLSVKLFGKPGLQIQAQPEVSRERDGGRGMRTVSPLESWLAAYASLVCL